MRPETASPGGGHDLSSTPVDGIGVQGHVHQVEADAWSVSAVCNQQIPWKYHLNTMENWDSRMVDDA